MKCRGCDGNNFRSVLDLGEQPWCNDFLKEEQLGKELEYPLRMVHCNDCELLQLDHTVPKETMFSDHKYLSGPTKSLTKHFLRLAAGNRTQFNLKEDDIILDIGGNDGAQLLQYKRLGLNNCVNVESAGAIAKISQDAGITTINDFFNEECVKNNFEKNSVKLINAAGVFFHLEELHSVIRGIKYALKEDGVFVIQFMYAGAMVDNGNFDTVYHEHLCYYTLRSVEKLLEPYGLKVFD